MAHDHSTPKLLAGSAWWRPFPDPDCPGETLVEILVLPEGSDPPPGEGWRRPLKAPKFEFDEGSLTQPREAGRLPSGVKLARIEVEDGLFAGGTIDLYTGRPPLKPE
jgi:hypothetical protein